jgi:teichuronic acid biosynthesis glycosyltransferase TuaG
MDIEPKVSIVIPTYNHADYLCKALESVINQTYTDWEAIVVNNYSEDNTEEIVQSFNDERIQLVNFHNNGIIASSRNHALQLAKGEFIAFLDSDDEWFPEKLENCISLMDGKLENAVCHAERWLGVNGYKRDVLYGPESRATYRSLLFKGNTISTSAVVVRRSVLEDVGLFSEQPEMVTAEDYDLWIRIVKSGTNFVFIPTVLGIYRIHPDGNSQAVLKNVYAILTVIENQFREHKQIGILEKLHRRRAKGIVLYGGGRTFQKQGFRLSAFKLFALAWIKFPFFTRLYLAILLNCLPEGWRVTLDR